ncbi:MAG TPA: glycosyltransferase family 2 protein [Longimicrobium sp.]|jgi:glycosyltransferase involved in cell wall biosynthesis|uniref:glycosyltransferase family 2 protein n=1 Tax=Longimicrobium sp. TaxID=2029185 RepID=UPI002EDBB415
MTIDILLTVYNGVPFLGDQLRSLQAQTHQDWRLWVRDDGSTDGSWEVVLAAAREDGRILPLEGSGTRLGARSGFAWLLEHADDGRGAYAMFCDQDDVWLPEKVEVTLAAMRRAEAEAGASRPVLVHTDLAVVDAGLATLDPSFWHYQGIRPELNQLNRLLYQNTVTGCTAMINRPLRRLATPVPDAAVMHDWWLALLASAFGRVVPLPQATILYRQHGRNDTGARRKARRGAVVGKALRALGQTGAVRRGIRSAAAQAGALLRRFESDLGPEEREVVARFAELPRCGPVKRRWRMIRMGSLTHHGLLGDIGLVLRA